MRQLKLAQSRHGFPILFCTKQEAQVLLCPVVSFSTHLEYNVVLLTIHSECFEERLQKAHSEILLSSKWDYCVQRPSLFCWVYQPMYLWWIASFKTTDPYLTSTLYSGIYAIMVTDFTLETVKGVVLKCVSYQWNALFCDSEIQWFSCHSRSCLFV